MHMFLGLTKSVATNKAPGAGSKVDRLIRIAVVEAPTGRCKATS